MKNPGVSKNPRKNKKTKNASFVRCFSGPIYFLDDIAHVLFVSRDFQNFIHEILYLLEVTKGQKKNESCRDFSLEAVGASNSWRRRQESFPGWVNELLQGGPQKTVRNGVRTPINGLTNG